MKSPQLCFTVWTLLQIPTQSGKRLNLLLLGMSGVGKSATLKSVVMKDDINIHGGWKTVTDICQMEEGMFEDYVIKVVDTPGLFSTNIKSKENHVNHFRRAVNETFQRFPDGFHALVLVLSYGRRFGQEDAQTIRILRDVFGEHWLKTHGVVVVTFADNFHYDTEGSGLTFADWCKNQRGPMGEIFKECNFRCASFDNITTINKTMNSQRALLFSAIRKIRESPFCFTRIHGDTSSARNHEAKSIIPAQKRQELDPPQREIDRSRANPMSCKSRSGNLNCHCSTSNAFHHSSSGEGLSIESMGKEGRSTQAFYPNNQGQQPSNKAPAVSCQHVGSVDKNKLLMIRQHFLETFVFLKDNLRWDKVQDCYQYLTMRLQEIQGHLSTEQEYYVYFKKSIEHLEELVYAINQNIHNGVNSLVEVDDPLEDRILSIFNRLEQDLDHVLTRWEREPKLNTVRVRYTQN